MAKRLVIGGLAVGVGALVLAPGARTWLRRRLGLEPEDRKWFEEESAETAEHEGDEPLDTREARFSLRARLAEEGHAVPPAAEAAVAEPDFPAFEEPTPQAPDFPAFSEPAPVVEAPVDEAPEEPAADEPAAEEPAVAETPAWPPPVAVPSSPEPATEEPAAEAQAPAVEEPSIEVPATEEPAVEEPVAEEPAIAAAPAYAPPVAVPPYEEPAEDEPVTEESPAAEDAPAEEPAPEEPAAAPAPSPWQSAPAAFPQPAPEPAPEYISYESLPAVTPEADQPAGPGEDTNEIEPIVPADEADASDDEPPLTPPTMLRPPTSPPVNRPFSGESPSFRSAIDAARQRVHGAAREATPEEDDAAEPSDDRP